MASNGDCSLASKASTISPWGDLNTDAKTGPPLGRRMGGKCPPPGDRSRRCDQHKLFSGFYEWWVCVVDIEKVDNWVGAGA